MLLVALAALMAGGAFGQSLRWGQLPGTASDISVAPNGDVWIVGTDAVAGGYGIYRFDGTNWARLPGGATRIAAGPQGPWVANSEGAIFRWDGRAWQKMPGAAYDIGVGADGSVWVIGTNAEAGGYGIYRWNAGRSNWDKVPGSAERIAVDSRGNAIVVNKAKEVFVWMSAGLFGQFMRLPGTALDVGTGADGSVFIVGTDHGLYQLAGGNWQKREGTFDTVAVDPRGSPWAINARKEIFAAGRGAAPALPGDVTAKLENLGIANNARFGSRTYARNPWDMKAYRGKVYIGSGNSNNEGPDTNAGPVDVTYFDPATGKFGSEGQVNDEQIDLFRITGGALTIPGHDPRENWTKGNFYRRAGENSWQQVRTVDMAIHMYDITERTEAAPATLTSVDRTGFGTKYLFAAIATLKGAEVAISSNGGQSWATSMAIPVTGARSRTFLQTPSALCLSAHINTNVPNVSTGGLSLGGSAPIPRADAGFIVSAKGVQVVRANLFPGMAIPQVFAAKPETFNGQAYYLGAYAPIDHNWKSEGMFATADCMSARRIVMPAGRFYHHILADGGKLYVMTSDEEAGGRRNRLFASADGGSFKEILSFFNKGFARSFAILDGDFYFGIGCEAEAQHAETGTILRLKAAQVPKG